MDDIPRSPGIHGYDLIFCNYKFKFRSEKKNPPVDDRTLLLYWMGHAFQYFLVPSKIENIFPSFVFSEPKEYVLDGVPLTPDIVNLKLDKITLALGELKTTRANKDKFSPQESPHYLEQIINYCKVLDLLDGALIVLFICGNYAPPFPSLKSWHIWFTKKEVNENWEKELEKKAILEECQKSGGFPTKHFMAFSAECKFCECKEICPKKNG